MEDENQYQKTIGDYINIFIRRKYYFLMALFLTLFIGTLVVFILPTKYQSSAKVLIESQQIPSDFVRSTVNTLAGERIEVIRQKILTTPKIMEIIKKFNLYKDKKSSLPVSAMSDLFRESVEIEYLTARRGRNSVTFAFNLSFSDTNAKTTQEVANKLVTLFLAENVKSRTERASETTEFLLHESEKIKEKIIELEDRLSEFKASNTESLPEYVTLNINKMERLENEYQSITSKALAVKDRVSFLQSELRRYSSVVGAETEIDRLNDELNNLLLNYTENYPTVKELRARIKMLEQMEHSKLTSNNQQNSIASVDVRAQLRESKTELKQIQLRQTNLEQELKETEQRILNAPEIEKVYTELNRDYENMLEKYREMKDKELESRIAQNLEEEKKGERFTLLEPPLYPNEPNKPNRKKLLSGVVGIAFAMGFGLVFLVEMFNPAVRGEKEIASIFGELPLVTVPEIESDNDIQEKKKKILIFVLILSAIFVFLFVGIHLFFIKLDVLLYTVLSRLSAL